MSHPNDPLANYYADEEVQEKNNPEKNNPEKADFDPLANYYYEEPKYRDVISEELRAKGYEPDFSDELERAADFGTAEVTKGAISGATLGLSEYIPGLKPGDNAAAKTGEIIGSTLPITGLTKIFNNPLTRFAAKSPILQKQLTSLAHLTGSFVSGGTYGATTEAIKKEEMPSVDDFIDNGASWALLDGALQAAGASGRFAKAVFSKSKQTNKPEWKIVNETINKLREEGEDFSNPERVQAKALSILEEAPFANENKNSAEINEQTKALNERKVEQQFFDKLEGDSVPEPYFPKQFEAIEVLDNVANEQINESLENLSPRVATQKQLGENIKVSVESAMKDAEATYTPDYQKAEDAAAATETIPYNTAKLATKTLQSIEALKTNPEGYSQVKKTLQNVIEDAGFIINRDENGAVEFAVSKDGVRTNKLMELARRLNKIIKYDSIDKQVRDRLKPIVQAIKQDIKHSIEDIPGALEAFENAEKEFGKAANKFGTDTIRKIRKLNEGEKIAKLIRTPSTLAELKEILPSYKFKEIERELLEHMRSLSEDKARAFYREIRPSLSLDAQVVGEEILESKTPRTEPSRKEALRSKTKEILLNDLSKTTITGERPEAALKLWRTKEGQMLIKDALKDNPNKQEILDYLSNQSLKDISATIVSPDGTINFKKLKELLKDPAVLSNIKLIGGEEGVQFMHQLGTLAKRAERNIAIMEDSIGKGRSKVRKEVEQALENKGKERFKKIKEKAEQKSKDSWLYKIDDLLKSYGIKTKALLTLLGIAKFGIPGVLETATVYEIFRQILKNKGLRKAIKQASGPRTDPKYLINAYEAINKAMED